MKSIHRCLCLLSLFFGLSLLMACQPSPEQIAARTATAQTAIAALWTPTPTVTPTATQTDTPTVTPSATVTATTTPTAPPASTPTPDNLYVSEDQFISFIPPQDWKASQKDKHLLFTHPGSEGYPPTLDFMMDQYSLFGTLMNADDVGIAMFSAFFQDEVTEGMNGSVTNFQQISEENLTTAQGKPYFRWVIEYSANGVKVHQTAYIFGSSKWFLVCVYSRLKDSNSEIDASVEKSMESMNFTR